MLASAAPEILIAAIAAVDRAHPGRQRRRDAAALQPAQGRRDVQHPRRAARRPDRPRHRPRARLGSRDDVRAAARPPADVARTTSPSSSPSCSPTSRTTSRPTTRSRGSPRSRARPARPDVWLLGSSPQSAIWAGELGPAVLVRRLHQPRRRARTRVLYRERFQPSRRRAQPELAVVRRRRSAPTPTRRRERLASSQRMAITLLRRGRLIAVPPVEKALAFLAEEGERRGGRGPARRRRHAGHRARRARGGRGRVRRRRADDRDDHARPRRAAPLVRADRRGVRAAARALVARRPRRRRTER